MSYYPRRRSALLSGRLVIAVIIALVSLVSYFGSRQYNPITNETQHVANISPQQEIALGLQAAPEMAQQYAGLSDDQQGQSLVSKVGQRLVTQSSAKDAPYKFEFHLLGDHNVINAFALPGGQIFITEALLKRLQTEGQVAGVLAHEMMHVVGRHGAEHIAKQQLTSGLTGAAVIASYDPNNPSSRNTAAVAAIIGQLVGLRFSRNDESEADEWGLKFMSQAGYNPNSMLRVMEILRDSAKGQHIPEFFSTHPDPGNRLERIQQEIQKMYPNGVPSNLQD